jgi:hypothetical protein
MARYRVTRESADHLVEMVKQHQGSRTKAAQALGLNVGTLKSRLQLARDAGFIKDLPPRDAETPPLLPSTAPDSYDTAWRAWQGIIGQTQEHYDPPDAAHGDLDRVVVASDFHVPFHDPRTFAAVLEEGSRADTLIIGGDLMDFYSVSRFMKYEQVDALSELAATTLALEQLASAYKKVVVVEGNHDRPRFEKNLRASLAHTPDVLHVIEWLVSFHAKPTHQGPILSPIAAIASRYPNVTIAQHAVGNHNVGWFTQYGDCLIAHTEKFSKVPGAVLRQVDDYFSDYEKVYGLAPWKVLMQAHTHAMGWFPWRADKLLVELGCCCKVHGYQLSPTAMGRPQRNGYVTLTQEHGKTIMSTVRPHWLDVR